MIIKELDDFGSSEFEQCIKIYNSSFPSNEIRPVQKVVETLKHDENYHLYVSIDNSSVIGISLMYAFKALRFGLLDYIAVIPNYRGRDIGKDLFNFTLEKFGSLVSNGIGLLMEIQKESGLHPEESAIRKNRISFYTLLGSKVLVGVNYLLPPLHYGVEPEEMHLMIKPLTNIRQLSKASVIRFVRAIYSTIYEYPHDDLLHKITKEMPAKIMLRTLAE
ncbi:MAG: GNAT family N-acetyltransferase [Candidatus Nitrosopolaris sp.]